MSRDPAAIWRSVEELAELPAGGGRRTLPFADPIDRRRLMQLMAASVALGGLTGCGEPGMADAAIPYVEQPPGIVPGKTGRFASAVTRDGYAAGIVALHRMGRPINLEGNPDHPASLGAIDPITQSAILDLYDPDRSHTVLARGQVSTTTALISAVSEQLARLRATGGEGLRLLTGRIGSPSLAAQLQSLQQRFPGLRRHCWDSGFRDNVRAGAALAFGRPVETIYNIDRAEIILAIESDLLDAAPGHLAYARAFGRRRRPEERLRPIRLYAVESTPTLTGANADHRFAVAASRLELVLRAVAARLSAGEAPVDGNEAWVAAIADDLASHRGSAFVHVGPEQPAALHALAHSINERLGAPGQTLSHIEPVETDPQDQLASISELVSDLQAGRVQSLVILGGNPVFTAPADLGFVEAMQRARLSLHLATHPNETSVRAMWHLPEAHELECWGDAHAFDGTVTILQPQLRPLYGGWSPQQLLALLGGDLQPNDYTIVRTFWENWARDRAQGEFESFWTDALRRGIVSDTRAATVSVRAAATSQSASAPIKSGGLLALFRPDPWLRDGRHANNGWLQELPRPLTGLTWDNAALIAPETATRLNLVVGQTVDLKTSAGGVKAPIFILPGQAPDCLTLPLGFGRETVGRVGANTGFNAFAARGSTGLWEAPVELTALSEMRSLATTQGHDRMEGRDLVRTGTLAEFGQDSENRSDEARHDSLYPEFAYPRNAWAMAIDLGACIGCGACTAACQAENNIPIVGKEEVLRAREMHWLRVDRYYRGSASAPEMLFQPVPCMHCENAPCEVVCPVEATVHDTDGLNVMVYNRCVGTRFCSNNCPWKVRRFNFFNYAAADPRLDVAWNPDLSVRARGVMEKCTYCIQRIREARITADREDRPIGDGEVVTACQAACPSEAIVFGDLNDPNSAVRKRKSSRRDYALLGDLNTRPRTTYQERLLNPNPAIAASDQSGDG